MSVADASSTWPINCACPDPGVEMLPREPTRLGSGYHSLHGAQLQPKHLDVG